MNLPAPILQAVSNSEYMLTEPYLLESLGYVVTCSPGLRIDGASIPRLFWRVFGHPLQGLILPGATIHDGLYLAQLTTRKVADDIFKDINDQNDLNSSWRVPWLKEWLAYRAVRIGGANPWNRRTESERIFWRQYVTVRKAI